MIRFSAFSALCLAVILASGPVLSDDLSSNIMRRVDTTNRGLERVEGLIETGHATLVDLRSRIDALTAGAESAKASAAEPTKPSTMAPSLAPATTAENPEDLIARLDKR